MRKISGLLMAAGVLVVLGTAGASDMGNISLWQSLLQVLGGAGLLLAGYAGRQLAAGRKASGKASVRRRRPSRTALSARAVAELSGLAAPADLPPRGPAGPVSSPAPRRIA